MRNVAVLFLCLYCFCAYLFASNIGIKDSKMAGKHTLLQEINTLISTHTLPKNTKANRIQCALTQQERNAIKLTYPTTFYEYYNALLEINRADVDISKFTQDLLVESMQYNDIPSLLLAMQLYFSKQCDRCQRVRDISMFDYYHDKKASVKMLLISEGGGFYTSYAVVGEAFLCKALQTESEDDFLMAYSNLMMAGLHTRAMNILLQGIKTTNGDMLYATLQFLVSFDNVIAKHEITAYFLRIMRVKGTHSFANIMALPYFKHLEVLEYNGNVILQALLLRDMEMGRILSPFDIFATRQTQKEFWDKAKHYMQVMQIANMQILQHATLKQTRTYLKILRFKKKLWDIKGYPFAITYRK